MSAETFADTARAFDSVAAAYDGPLGNNILVQKMREQVMACIEQNMSPGARLLELGCGTGIDAEYLAARGYAIHPIDSSPAMVERTNARLQGKGLNAHAEVLGIHEIYKLTGSSFDGAFSNLGPLNCVPGLRQVSFNLAHLLKSNGLLIASVMGRYVPWEVLYYGLRGDFRRAGVRLARTSVAVPMNGLTVWTNYYSPREFAHAFEEEFETMHVRALGLFMPPPYLIGLYNRFPRIMNILAWLDETLGARAAIRNAGDHFLIVLRKKH